MHRLALGLEGTADQDSVLPCGRADHQLRLGVVVALLQAYEGDDVEEILLADLGLRLDVLGLRSEQ
eukprot:4142782-Pyramimonas_sp.AAC.1